MATFRRSPIYNPNQFRVLLLLIMFTYAFVISRKGGPKRKKNPKMLRGVKIFSIKPVIWIPMSVRRRFPVGQFQNVRVQDGRVQVLQSVQRVA